MIKVFVDGSCSKKTCGIGIYFPNKEYKNISKKFKYYPLTNQRAELYAIYKTIITVKKFKQLHIYSDSKYAISCVTEWINTWKINNWKTANNKNVKNQDLIKKIDSVMKKNIFFHHVKAHTSKSDFESIGNKIADILSKNASN